MGTSTLRGVILVAAVILGVVGLTQAFPQSDDAATLAPSPRPGGGQPSPSPSPTPTASPRATASPRVEGVVVQILNGTDVDGLATEVSAELEEFGYSLNEPGNATATERTIVFFQAGSRTDANFLADEFFEGALIRPANQQAASDADITVILGQDFAEARAEATAASS